MSNIHYIIQELNKQQAKRFLEIIDDRIDNDSSDDVYSDNDDARNTIEAFFGYQNADDMTKLLLHSIAEQSDSHGVYLRSQLEKFESRLKVERELGPMRGGVVDVFQIALGAMAVLGTRIQVEKENGKVKFQIDVGLLAIPELAGIFKALKSKIENKNPSHITITDSKNVIISSTISSEGEIHIGEKKENLQSEEGRGDNESDD